MGMRFMARKREAEEAQRKTRKERQEREQMEWTAEQDNGDEPAEEGEEAQIAQQATASDMYGLRSDLVGRRSFGGFQPKVNDTWKSAWSEWEKKGNASEKILHISDDELLRRYENGNVDSSAAAPIGNLQDKLKKGKRRNQSLHHGEKRKR
jgi:hypothetical protein